MKSGGITRTSADTRSSCKRLTWCNKLPQQRLAVKKTGQIQFGGGNVQILSEVDIVSVAFIMSLLPPYSVCSELRFPTMDLKRSYGAGESIMSNNFKLETIGFN